MAVEALGGPGRVFFRPAVVLSWVRGALFRGLFIPEVERNVLGNLVLDKIIHLLLT